MIVMHNVISHEADIWKFAQLARHKNIKSCQKLVTKLILGGLNGFVVDFI